MIAPGTGLWHTVRQRRDGSCESVCGDVHNGNGGGSSDYGDNDGGYGWWR